MSDTERDARSIRPRREADRFASFLAYLREIEQALMHRDAMRITALLRKRTATHMPRDVREELLFLSRASRDSVRAPIRFLRFQHRMTQLASGGEKLPTAQIELEFEPCPLMGAIRLRSFEDRRAAAHEGVDPPDPAFRAGDDSE
jgi:hypothetical protein